MEGNKHARPEDTKDAGDRGNADTNPLMFQSRLQAKREERMQQRQLEQTVTKSQTEDANTKSFAISGLEAAGEDIQRRRERAEARKRVIENQGNVWDAVVNNDLKMVQSYFLVEGAENVLRRRHPDADQGGRSLLHCAAWYGFKAIVEFILSTGFMVDALDSVASSTTALLEAARAGHADVCVCLLQHGANPRHRDSYGDTAFHWAGRRGHGIVLMRMALEQERLEPGSTPAIWVSKNYKGRTVVELVQGQPFVTPLLQKRLGSSFTRALESAKGKRRSRFAGKAPGVTKKASLTRADTRPAQGLNEEPDSTALSGVQELGLDVSSFAYRAAFNDIREIDDQSAWDRK